MVLKLTLKSTCLIKIIKTMVSISNKIGLISFSIFKLKLLFKTENKKYNVNINIGREKKRISLIFICTFLKIAILINSTIVSAKKKASMTKKPLE